ncbi:metallophosphoesterase [Prolixibacteraceae bacterium Z1-6]|uniref:Metallophosphoesterase n=1 Tax=Draconibacterium aestuarii TaxID=2998507 RepID=A0A9X3J3N0_9BACT|nr:metallophosphoesterase [Prolixibacteraceae bacterium Z1-6]
MNRIVFLSIISVFIFACQPNANTKQTGQNSNNFSFVFMTDIHLTEARDATKGFLQAVDTINKIAPDFVLTGGDNIMDALAVSYTESVSAYDLFEESIKKLNMPVYSTMGNHEVFGLYERSGVSPDHEEYGKKLYENRLAQRYYSFDHKNWHFVVLDAIGFTDDRHYYGHIDAEQLVWLKQDLDKIGDRPVVVSTHIPLLSVGAQIMNEPTAAMSNAEIVTNASEVREILEQYNTKLVLQGHLHFLEDIQYNGINYITGGAVCASWWQGPRFGMEEGFIKVKASGEDFDWEYVDYGWEVAAE